MGSTLLFCIVVTWTTDLNPSFYPSFARVWCGSSKLRFGEHAHLNMWFLRRTGWVMCVKQVTEEQSYALLEYVVHLIAKDYPATLDDLIVLGESRHRNMAK